VIDRPWKMYPLGVLFGLGFDTSSEIALLGISAIHAAKGTSIWLILLFPVMFTAGMCLVDTIDGALMLTVYVLPMDVPGKRESGEGRVAESGGIGNADDGGRQGNGRVKDPLTFLYYSIVLTALTVIVALVIGIIQLLTMILNVAEPSGRFWDGVESAAEHYDLIGGAICASFVFFGVLSILLYKPWRRRAERYRQTRRQPQQIGEEEEQNEQRVVWEGATGIIDQHADIGAKHVKVIAADVDHAPESSAKTVGRTL
jgi:nickel/cobalt transporter (NiCoT) family protein